jgi:hypothetical protein
MADWGDTIEDLIAWRDAWIEEYGIDWGNKKGRVLSLEDMSQSDHERIKKLDKKNLVWSEHSTCEDNYFTPGYHVFEGSGCGCWVTYSFYIAEVPWEDENERIDATAHLPCPVCNADGEGEGDPDCEGPELPENEYGVDLADGCEDGFIQVYLD